MQWVVGIDEAGRGPLAGPVAVGVVKTPGNFDWSSKLPGVTDSKKLSPEKRSAFFRQAKALKKASELDFAVAMVGPRVIDREGIVRAIAMAMARALRRLEKTTSSSNLRPGGVREYSHTPIDWSIGPADFGNISVKLDGGLRAPARYPQQETIIKGDLTEPAISLASILAKETRDAYMRRIAAEPQFAAYDFATHKGYGTVAHRAAITEYGISQQHRNTYCKNIFRKL